MRDEQKTILVVEDFEDEAFIYATVLEHAGYAVIGARSADEAVGMAHRHHPDLILMDIHLAGGRSGCDAIEELRQSPDTDAIPVIAHTAFPDIYVDQIRRTGCDGLLSKPVDPAYIVRAVADRIGPPRRSG